MANETIEVQQGEKHNLEIPQGETFTITFTFKDSSGNPVDLTDYYGRCQFRETVDAATVLYDSTLSGVGEISSTTYRYGDITVEFATGKVTLKIPAATTAAFAFTSAKYDLEIVSPAGDVTRLVKGNIKVDPEVTR